MARLKNEGQRGRREYTDFESDYYSTDLDISRDRPSCQRETTGTSKTTIKMNILNFGGPILLLAVSSATAIVLQLMREARYRLERRAIAQRVLPKELRSAS